MAPGSDSLAFTTLVICRTSTRRTELSPAHHSQLLVAIGTSDQHLQGKYSFWQTLCFSSPPLYGTLCRRSARENGSRSREKHASRRRAQQWSKKRKKAREACARPQEASVHNWASESKAAASAAPLIGSNCGCICAWHRVSMCSIRVPLPGTHRPLPWPETGRQARAVPTSSSSSSSFVRGQYTPRALYLPPSPVADSDGVSRYKSSTHCSLILIPCSPLAAPRAIRSQRRFPSFQFCPSAFLSSHRNSLTSFTAHTFRSRTASGTTVVADSGSYRYKRRPQPSAGSVLNQH